jgi:hypothetical protein
MRRYRFQGVVTEPNTAGGRRGPTGASRPATPDVYTLSRSAWATASAGVCTPSLASKRASRSRTA